MKHKALARVLAIIMAFSLVSTAFAANATHTDLTGNVTEGEVTTFLGGAETGVKEGTVTLTEDVTVSTDNGQGMTALVINPGVNFDLGGHTLTVEKGTTPNPVEDYGIPTSGIVTTGQNEISNGKIEVGEDIDVGIWESKNQASLDGVEMEAKSDDTTLVRADDGVTLTDCTLDASKVVDGDGDSKNITFVSGVYDNLSDVLESENDNYKLANGSSEYNVPDTPGQDDSSGQPGEPAKKPTIIVSEKTTAVVKDADGKYHTYDDLSKAVESNKGRPVTVLNQEVIKDLKLDADETLMLLDKDGKAIDAAASIEVPDGYKAVYDKDSGTIKVVEDKQGPVDPNPPIIIDPGIEGPGEMDGPGEVEIDDPDTPLAGFPITLAPTDKLTRGMLAYILHWMDEAPAAELASFIDVAADSDYAEAIGWASANGIANGVGGNKFAPEDGVTRGQLVTMLNRYAKYVGSDVTAELNGDANEIVTWAVAEEIINDFFARLYA